VRAGSSSRTGAQIDFLFACTNHENEAERAGLAQGLGYAAATHLDNVIARLQAAIKSALLPVALRVGVLTSLQRKSRASRPAC
jgi:hypothetical protein